MITLSNGWFSNSISQSHLAKIAKAAHKSAMDERSADAELRDDSLEMRLPERVFDLVFCRSVKYDYMNSLFEVTKKRVLMEGMLRDRSTHPDTVVNEDALRELQDAVNTTKHAMNGLTPENTLDFCNATTADPEIRELYLVYRDAGSFTPIGIPVVMSSSSFILPRASGASEVSIPDFRNIKNIRCGDLIDIQKSGQLRCGDKLYKVRFTHHNEPIVEQSEAVTGADELRNRLRNLWLISHLKKEFSESNNEDGAQLTELIFIKPRLPRLFTLSRERVLGNLGWLACGVSIHEKFQTAVNLVHARLNNEINEIAEQLAVFEDLTNPTSAEIDALRALRMRIILFREKKKSVIQKIHHIREKLENICSQIVVGDDVQLEAIVRSRLINFCDQLLIFVQSEMDEPQFNAFIALCKTQQIFFNSFIPDSTLFDWGLYWDNDEIHAPVLLPEQLDTFFSLLKDPASSWEVCNDAFEQLKQTKLKSYEIKKRQIALGHEYAKLLDEGLIDENNIKFSKLNISPKFNSLAAQLSEIVDACLLPGNQFTEQEVDEIERNAKKIWYDLWDEHENGLYRQRVLREKKLMGLAVPLTFGL